MGGVLDGSRARLRDMAHELSDLVFEQLTGIPGAFSTKVLYVVAQNIATEDEVFRLEMADADGARPYTLLESPEPILSADWAPDGRSLRTCPSNPGVQRSSCRRSIRVGARN